MQRSWTNRFETGLGSSDPAEIAQSTQRPTRACLRLVHGHPYNNRSFKVIIYLFMHSNNIIVMLIVYSLGIEMVFILFKPYRYSLRGIFILI